MTPDPAGVRVVGEGGSVGDVGRAEPPPARAPRETPMDSDLWRRARELFDHAVDLPPAEREAFIASATAGDAGLRDEVRSLLEADASAPGTFLEDGVPASALAPAGEEGGWRGMRFGPYRAVALLGRGGTAVVLLGERADGRYDRQVAIKVLQSPWPDAELSRRFDAEGRFLARLSHPNVARIHDAGETEQGLPYLVMEYVDGPRLDRYADERMLTVEERLRLFCEVLEGVAYAHGQGIVHRDLKPSNILVAADGRPRLVDFGIAKLLRDGDGVGSPRTRTGAAMLTPEYASPEQVAGRPVDERTDVYSLGVLLYRLLTGHPPYDLSGSPAERAGRIVREQQPDPPSRVVTRPVAPAPTPGAPSEATPADATARSRRSTPDGLHRALRGDLDTVVLKALAKDPKDRYPGVAALADDVRRHLDGRPVLARPPGLGYRARKLVVRRRGALAAGGALVLALAFGGWQAREARVERRAAAARSAELLGLVESVVDGANLAQRQAGDDTRARAEAVSAALASLQQLVDDLPGEPGADLLYRLSAAYRELAMVQGYPYMENLGRLDEGFATMGTAVELVRRVAEEYPDHAGAPAALGQQVGILGDFHMGAGRPDSALAYFVRSAEILSERVRRVPDDLAAVDGLGAIQQRIGSWYYNARRLDSAAVFMERALETERDYLGRTTRGDEVSALQDIAGVTANLGTILAADGDLEGAIAREREAVALADSLARAGDAPLTGRRQVISRLLLATHLAETGEVAEARAVGRQALERARELAAADTTDVLAGEDLVVALIQVAFVAWSAGDPEEAVALGTEGLARAARADSSRFAMLGPSQAMGHRIVGEALSELADLDGARARLDTARGVVARYLERFGAGSPGMRRERATLHLALARHERVRALDEGATACARAAAHADSARSTVAALRAENAFTRGDEERWQRYAALGSGESGCGA